MGGTSAEREVSLMSGGGVLQALRARGVDAHAFDPAHADLSELKTHGYNRCFIALHGRHGEDGTVQGALELLGIPYTGSGVMASSIAMDKVMTKRIWLAEGLPTPDWRLVASAAETEQAVPELGAADDRQARARGLDHRPDQGHLARPVRAGLPAGRAARPRGAVRAVHRRRRNHLPGAGRGR